LQVYIIKNFFDCYFNAQTVYFRSLFDQLVKSVPKVSLNSVNKIMLPKTRTTLIVLLLFLFSTSCFASFEFKGYGSTYTAGGSAGIASFQNEFGIFLNPAKLTRATGLQVNLFYRNYYGISDLNQITLGSQFLINKLPFGFGISRYGSKIYSETEIRLGTGINIFEAIHFGISLNTYHLEIQNYGSTIGVGFDISALYSITPNLTSAFVISNANEPKLGKISERIPAYFALGVSYKIFADTEICFDVVKDAEFDFDYRFGINYSFKNWLTLILGYRDQVNSFSTGFNLGKNQLTLGYAFVYHPLLGGSNSISMGYAF
jgi:hypothetical protein